MHSAELLYKSSRMVLRLLENPQNKGLSMQVFHALKILGLNHNKTIMQSDIKKRYRELCREFHPDINPAGEHLMKQINAAYDYLYDLGEPLNFSDLDHLNIDFDLHAKLSAALQPIVHLKEINIEICGSWIWVSGETLKNKDLLKKSGFLWAPKKCMWYWHDGKSKSSSRSRGLDMSDIRSKYGSTSFSSSLDINKLLQS